ncbi:MAG TPA: hypothetical protein VM537_07970, partial [Anaerolineae bacterium]|nr:hypothetical protein [Anaerolineae bacterium]
MTIGMPFVPNSDSLLVATLFLGSLLVLMSLMARRAMHADLEKRARYFVPRRNQHHPDSSPARLGELQEMRSQYLFLRAIEVYGLGYFLSLPAALVAQLL